MAILHNIESVPTIGDTVVKTMVDIYFSTSSFSYDFDIEFKSGKTNTLSGSYGNNDNTKYSNSIAYENFSKAINKIDLEKYKKYKDDEYENSYLIPLDIFTAIMKD